MNGSSGGTDGVVASPRVTLLPSLANLGFRMDAIADTPFIVPPVSHVPSGLFVMGSDRAVDSVAYLDESPMHQVGTAEFWLGTYPVTVAEYAFAMRDGVVQSP